MRVMREMVILRDGEKDARNQEAIKNVEKNAIWSSLHHICGLA
jgi:hypothetical protein